jgi:DNA-binding NarL/FixJ family response regulator
MGTSGLTIYVLSGDSLLQARWQPLQQAPHAFEFHHNSERLLQALRASKDKGNPIVVIDAGGPATPAWKDPFWTQLSQQSRWVYATTAPSEEEGLTAIQAGAVGYCHLYAALPTWLQVIDVIQSGQLWIGKQILGRLLSQLSNQFTQPMHSKDPTERSIPSTVTANQPSRPNATGAWQQILTAREVEVAKRAAWGDSNAAIADALGITERTVKAHVSTIFTKLSVGDRLQLALLVHGVQRT